MRRDRERDRVTCEELHTPRPGGYAEFHEWCKKMSKTHKQARCPVCNRWAIWIPKGKKVKR